MDHLNVNYDIWISIIYKRSYNTIKIAWGSIRKDNEWIDSIQKWNPSVPTSYVNFGDKIS